MGAEADEFIQHFSFLHGLFQHWVQKLMFPFSTFLWPDWYGDMHTLFRSLTAPESTTCYSRHLSKILFWDHLPPHIINIQYGVTKFAVKALSCCVEVLFTTRHHHHGWPFAMDTTATKSKCSWSCRFCFLVQVVRSLTSRTYENFLHYLLHLFLVSSKLVGPNHPVLLCRVEPVTVATWFWTEPETDYSSSLSMNSYEPLCAPR